MSARPSSLWSVRSRSIKLIVGDLAALAERGKRRVLFDDFEHAGVHAPFVFVDVDLLAAFADRDVAVGLQ